MSKRYLTYVLLACLPMMNVLHAQTIHPSGIQQMLLVSDDDLTGTPRFVGMAGAMTAIGGDPSAVKHNPAGLGIYRHSQFSVSADGCFMRFWQDGDADKGPSYSRWHLSQASYVFAITHPERVAGVVSNNIMISYAQRADIYRLVTINDRRKRTSNTQDWIENTLDEYGYRHDVDLHYAMNISNRVYWGLGMTLEWLQARQTLDRWEYAATDKRGENKIYSLKKNTFGNAVGWGGSAGVLVRPLQALRFGVSVESPIIGRVRQTDYYTEQFSYPGAYDRNSVYDSPDYNSSWQMVTPMKASAGIGLQWKNHGLLSLQYDMQYHNLAGVSHTARAGVELAVNHWMFEGGYAYSTLYARQRASVGVHYMGNWIRVGLAYACTWYKGTYVDEIYFTQQGVARTRENKIVLSFQWNS